MKFEVETFVLLVLLGVVVHGATDYSYCKNFAEYNTLADLMKNDSCMQADSVFKVLSELNLQEQSGGCRIHLINILADHFGHRDSTPHNCSCHGENRVQYYHNTFVDGIATIRDHCRHQSAYVNLYNQFFDHNSQYHHRMPCSTHHSIWSALRSISTQTFDHSSCQKDIIFHLKYMFEHITDRCTCTAHYMHSNGHQSPSGHGHDDCLQYDSYKTLLQLAETDGCMSANSVWHYLDDLQVSSQHCRKRIQQHMNAKYSTSHGASKCACTARQNLINHEIHRMNNGSFVECKYNTRGTYRDIEEDLFSNIVAKGCQNHHYLWNKLEGVHYYCKWYHQNHGGCGESVDCTQDLIVRAAIQYPTDVSDSCVCSKTTSASSTITSTSAVITPSPTTKVTPPTTTTKVTTPTTTTKVTTPTTTPTTEPPASATSVKVTHNVAMTTQQTSRTNKYTCNKLAVVEDIAKSLKATHPSSSTCDQNAGGSDDAFVLSTCTITSPMTWMKGANIMADCESSTQLIHTYTPISTFNGDNYTPLGAQSGIFLGCYNNGIKIAIQKCNGLPEIVNIENGTFLDNPRNYYAIV